MPFASRAQYRKFKELVGEGKISQETMDHWTKETPDLKALPNRVKPKKKMKKYVEMRKAATPKKNPDIPPYEDDKAAGWPQGVGWSEGFAKTSGSFFQRLKSSRPIVAGTTDKALEAYNARTLASKMSKMTGPATIGGAADIISKGTKKIASGNLAADAAQEANLNQNQQEFASGASLRANAETGQAKQKNYRTPGVLNENKEFAGKYKTKYQTARGGTNDGGDLSERFSKNR